MDPVPSTSSQGISPPRKRPIDLGHLSANDKQCIINIYKQCKTDEPQMHMVDIVETIKKSTGVVNSTIYRTIKEYRQTGTVHPPKHSGGRPSLQTLYDERVKFAVRQIVHSFFFKNELPTLDKILAEIKDHSDLPNISRSSLYKLMKMINFRYLKRNRKSILIERDDIVRWRRRYLTSLKQYRSEGRPVFYLDETWVNEGHTKSKVWVDTQIKSHRQAFIEGLSTGLKNPSGKGKRLIVLHIGSEMGFVDGGLLLFEGKKTGDYHEEMNAIVFEEWFQGILQKLPNNAIIVMDNAPYHSRRTEKIPTTSSTKKYMQEWLQAKNIPFNSEMVRSELLHIIKMNKENYNFYVTDEMAKANNKTVLRLPPYHCEFNPIEKIWAQVKNEVASKNTTFKLFDVKKLLLEALENVNETHWLNCVNHVKKEEVRMCELDGIMDTILEPILISINGEDSDASSSDEQ